MYVMVDVEADGPVPGLYSMVSLGAVVMDYHLDQRFFTEFGPISEKWIPEALVVSGYTREETLEFPHPATGMRNFNNWLKDVKPRPGRLLFISDNNGFDWQFVNYYFHRFLGYNPFGHSSTNLGSLYKGLVQDVTKNFKHLRDTQHTHNPIDDAVGNAEALLKMFYHYDLKVPGL